MTVVLGGGGIGSRILGGYGGGVTRWQWGFDNVIRLP